MILSLVWFWSTVLIACVVPNISVAISCIGSMAALFIFVFPAIAFLNTIIETDYLYSKNSTRAVIVYALLNAALGTFIFGQVLLKSIWLMYTGGDSIKKIQLCVK